MWSQASLFKSSFAARIPSPIELHSTKPKKIFLKRVKRGQMKTFNPSVATYAVAVATASCLTLLPVFASQIQQPDEASIIHRIDSTAQARYSTIASFTYTAHYTVYHGKDETTPIAEMTVNTTYRKGVGKSYVIVSESGSAVVQKFGLHPLLDNEKNINVPGNVEHSWFTSANYQMKLKPGVTQIIDGRNCLPYPWFPFTRPPIWSTESCGLIPATIRSLKSRASPPKAPPSLRAQPT